MFDSILFWLALASLVIWLGVVLQPWLPWLMRERFAAEPRDAEQADLSDTTVIVPARNEAESIDQTLAALQAQGQGLSVILVDDNSTDGTAEIARRLLDDRGVRMTLAEEL